MNNIAHFIRQIARGKHGSQHLVRADAASLFEMLLKPDADALQLGAFLIAERMKGESASELAGFVDAARAGIRSVSSGTWTKAIDFPCYAGKRRAAPMHLRAAHYLATHENIPIVVHGISDIEGRLSAWQTLQPLGVVRAKSVEEAYSQLDVTKIVYLDLADFCPELYRLMQLRERLGVRSFVNSVARMLNPLRCKGQLNGVFHTPYVLRLAEVNIKLGQPASLIFMGAEGEPELYADRQKQVMWQQGGTIVTVSYPEAGVEPYPKKGTAQPLELLGVDQSRRGESVYILMQEAIRLMSGGEMPRGWVTSGK
ncbi:MAG: anthranilate phosphoribosyltransferase [Mariprofundaceae bacterium]